MPLAEQDGFNAPAEVHSFSTLLFDMDGTIIDSTAAIIKHWHGLGKEIGVPGDVILQTSHGRRSIDVLALLKPELANWDFVKEREGALPKLYGADAVEIPGSRAILDACSEAGVPWGIVTSGTKPLVDGWLEVMKLAHPRSMVTAEDVAQGKPDPACYLLGAERVAASFSRQKSSANATLVFEDAPAGIKAGKAAGFKVIALATTHTIEAIREAKPDWIVKDMRSVTLSTYNLETGIIEIKIEKALR